MATRGDFLDKVDGIAYAGVLCNALVGEIDFAFCVNGNIFQKGVAADSIVDIGFAFFVEVDNLGIAATLEVEHAVIVPAVFVITDEQTFGIGRQCGLTGAAETEEDSCVFTLHVGVGRAVHRSHPFQRQIVVHD